MADRVENSATERPMQSLGPGPDSPLEPGREAVRISCSVSAGLAEWLATTGGSLAITTYQANRLALVGWNGQQVTFLMREFARPMGMALKNQQLALATRDTVTMFGNAQLLAADY